MIWSGWAQHAGRWPFPPKGGDTGTSAPPTDAGDWIGEHYYPTLCEEVSHALEQLHQATSWGVTIVTAGLIAVVSRREFPDLLSILMILGLAILNAHFMNRSLRGYLNVMRFGLIQKVILKERSEATGSTSESWHAIRTYHIKWYSPLTRRAVVWKGLSDLGFGYVFAGLAGALVFCLGATEISRISAVTVSIFATVVLVVEIWSFLRSPYMRNVAHSEVAHGQR